MKIRYVLLSFVAWQVCVAAAARPDETKNAEVPDLGQALVKVLPKGWSIENRITSIEIVGPEVRVVWPVSLPPAPKDVIWRDFSHAIQVRVTIHFQARIPDKDLAELRSIRNRFSDLTSKAANQRQKGWGDTIKEYGFIRLPHFQSDAVAIFVDNNTRGCWIQPEETSAVFTLIDKELAARFIRVPEK